MNDGTILEIGKNALMLTLLISAPLLGASLVVGLIVSIFQAATQINEMTLTFVPKVLAVIAILGFCAPWMMSNLGDYTNTLFATMAELATK